MRADRKAIRCRRPTLRANPTAYSSLSPSVVAGTIRISTVTKTGQYSTAKGQQCIYGDRTEINRSDANE